MTAPATESAEASLPAEDAQVLTPRSRVRARLVNHIFTITAPYVDQLSTGFSFGMDRWWRRRGVKLAGIKQGDRVMDICAGTGELSFILSDVVGPQGTVVATDFCQSMLDRAEQKAKGRSANVSFHFADAKSLPFPDASFDAVTVAFGIRNVPETILALKEVRRVLKPGGVFCCVELTRPTNPLLRALYSLYVFHIMPFISGFFLKSQLPYKYLPRSIETFYQPPEFCDVLEKRCGFLGVSRTSMSFGLSTTYLAHKPE
jgi:demethylmenaquinone methyltransferase / 2-methoxy-6-polyprenyl-1,4-benzoquinol methylase